MSMLALLETVSTGDFLVLLLVVLAIIAVLMFILRR
jgi:hypothetical protein